MAETLRFEVITPEAVAYAGDVRLVSVPTLDGRIAVLPHHVRLVTRIVPGEVVARKDGASDSIVVGGGLAVVTGGRMAIITDMAVAADKIDEAAVEEARRRALDRLRDKTSDEEVATVNAQLARALAQLKVKRRHRV